MSNDAEKERIYNRTLDDDHFSNCNAVLGQALEHCGDAARLVQAAHDPRLPNLHMIASLEQDPRFNGS